MAYDLLRVFGTRFHGLNGFVVSKWAQALLAFTGTLDSSHLTTAFMGYIFDICALYCFVVDQCFLGRNR